MSVRCGRGYLNGAGWGMQRGRGGHRKGAPTPLPRCGVRNPTGVGDEIPVGLGTKSEQQKNGFRRVRTTKEIYFNAALAAFRSALSLFASTANAASSTRLASATRFAPTYESASAMATGALSGAWVFAGSKTAMASV